MEYYEKEYTDKLTNGSIYKNDLEIVEKYLIKEFVPKDLLVRDGIMLINAMTGSGKTCLIKDLLSHVYKDYDEIYLMSKTAKLQTCYDFFEHTIDTFDEVFLSKTWNDRISKKNNNQKLPRTLIILDDLINEKNFKNSQIMKDIATGGRHVRINLWCLSQNFTSVSRLFRNNCSWAVSFDVDAEDERNLFISQFLSAKNKRVGSLLFKKITKEKPYQCIIIEVHKVGASTNDKVRKYVADPEPRKFKIKNNKKITAVGDEIRMNIK